MALRAVMHMAFVAVASTVALAMQSSSTEAVPAMQKVVQMLTDMSAKAKTALHDEQVSYAAFKTWCSSEQDRLAAAVKSERAEVESLGAAIGELQSATSVLSDELAQLAADEAKFEEQKQSHKAQREVDFKNFKAEVQDYGESVDAIERAIAVLQKQSFDRTALLQLADSQQLPGKAQRLIGAFLGMMNDGANSADPLDYAAPEANAYEFQSTSIIDMLKKLQDDFRSQKGETEKEEMNSAHAFDMVMEDLTNAVANAKKDAQEKTVQRQEKISKTGLLKEQLNTTTKLLAEDEKLLEDTGVQCREKKASFDEKQVLRQEEIEALQKAITILSSPEVAGSYDKYLTLAQRAHGNATALVQLGSNNVGGNAGIHRKLRDFLEKEGSRLHSKNLELIVQKLEADPFAKVKKLIEDMISRLLEETKADADHKGFCDKEMGQSKITRTRLQEEMDGLSAAIEEGKATIAMLSQDTAKLSADIAELTSAMKQASEFRETEKAKNAETNEDAAEAIKALQAATGVLKDFYAKAGQATALVQQPTMGGVEWNALANPGVEVDKGHREGMQTFGDTYKGLDQEAGGVLAMLEVIESDFANLKADTMAAEAAASKEFQVFMAESRKDKAAKEKAVAMDEHDKAAAEEKLRQDKEDYSLTDDKMLAANRYYDGLVPQCVDQGMTFEERTQARQEEIQSLKEALSILSNEDIANV